MPFWNVEKLQGPPLLYRLYDEEDEFVREFKTIQAVFMFALVEIKNKNLPPGNFMREAIQAFDGFLDQYGKIALALGVELPIQANSNEEDV